MKTIRQVIDQARLIYADEGDGVNPTAWDDEDLLDFLNDGRIDIYGAQPTVYEVTQNITLIAGHRQTVPAGSKKLFKLIANVSHSEKRAITIVDRELMGRLRPRWRDEQQVDEVLHYMYTGTETGVYEVYPPLIAGVIVQASYAAPPTPYTAVELGSGSPPTLSAEAELAVALVHYVLSCMYQRQADTSPGYAQRAADHMAQFTARIVGTENARRAVDPNNTSKAANPGAARG